MLWLALPCVLAVAVAGCLLVADLLGQVLALWQERPPSVRWLNAGAAGQGVLAAAAICVLAAGARRPGWRRGTVLAEVLIVVVAFGWFFLTAWLQRRALPSPGAGTGYPGLLRLPHDLTSRCRRYPATVISALAAGQS